MAEFERGQLTMSYRKGRRARRAGVAFEDNPYRGRVERHNWETGWVDEDRALPQTERES